MSEQAKIVFDDGAAYERMMGVWSRLAGDVFLDWLAPPPSRDWIDIGCGNGAFTELIVDRAAPRSVLGIDPSDAQLEFARGRPAARLARFEKGDAMALAAPGAAFDIATMALVIFFVPEPAKGVAEVVRVLRPGGVAAAYAWDLEGGGFPVEPVHAAMRGMGLTYVRPPNPDASRIDVLRQLWSGAGLSDIETREIRVTRRFADFDDFWTTTTNSTTLKATLAKLGDDVREDLRLRVRAGLAPGPDGAIVATAAANAVKGVKR